MCKIVDLLFLKNAHFHDPVNLKKGFFQSYLSSLFSVNMMTFERMIRLKSALVHFVRTQKEKTSSLTSHIRQIFQKLEHCYS